MTTATTITPAAFLAALYDGCGGLLELRAKRESQGLTGNIFLLPGDFNGLTQFAAAHRDGHVWFGVATRRDNSSGKLENCAALPALFVDLDFKHFPEEEARQRLYDFLLPPSAVVLSGGGLHVYWFLREPLNLRDPDECAMAGSLLRRLAHALGGDRVVAEPAHVLRVPGTMNIKYEPARFVRLDHLADELRYDPADFDAVLPEEPHPNGDRPPAASFTVPAQIRDGERNTTLYRAARSLKAKGYSQEAIRKALIEENTAKCDPPLDADELEATVAHAWEQADRPGFEPGTADAHGGGFPLTDSGNAEHLAARYGHALRYDHRRARWLLWATHRWIPDADAEVRRLGKAAARERFTDAGTTEDLAERTKLAKWALSSESRSRLDATLTLAQAEHPIADAGARWDADPMLLGVSNGVIDLRLGTLRPGVPDDRITMSTGVPFDPDATAPRWRRFLEEIFEGHPELPQYVQRAFGYSLTGQTIEQCFFLLYGTGSNGKGSAVNTFARALGDYAWNMPFSTVELHQRAAIPNDLAALVGKRFVVASEINDGSRLNESRLKMLTGCDPVTARFLHGEFFTFQPVGKFWFCVNHKPEIKDDSHGFWRRMHLIPFLRHFPLNKSLGDELDAEAAGILAWAVQGCLRWQQEGLNPPAIVTEATREYARDCDPLAEFLEDACETSPEATSRAAALYEHYMDWADRMQLNKRERLSSTQFGRKMGERFEHDRTMAGKVYSGVSPKRP